MTYHDSWVVETHCPMMVDFSRVIHGEQIGGILKISLAKVIGNFGTVARFRDSLASFRDFAFPISWFLFMMTSSNQLGEYRFAGFRPSQTSKIWKKGGLARLMVRSRPNLGELSTPDGLCGWPGALLLGTCQHTARWAAFATSLLYLVPGWWYRYSQPNRCEMWSRCQSWNVWQESFITGKKRDATKNHPGLRMDSDQRFFERQISYTDL